jgi:hypothetical protein
MHPKTARLAGVTGLTGLIGLGAALLALAAGGAAPALAATDTGGTFTVNIAKSPLEHLAKAGVVVLPTGTGTATSANAGEHITLQVSGGDATYVGTQGALQLAGGLLLTDGATDRSVALTSLIFSYDSGWITAVAGGHRIPLATVGGSETGSDTSSTQTFAATALYLGPGAAKYLDKELKTKYFKSQQDLGGFTTTYTVTS